MHSCSEPPGAAAPTSVVATASRQSPARSCTRSVAPSSSARAMLGGGWTLALCDAGHTTTQLSPTAHSARSPQTHTWSGRLVVS